jgi:hypothetical protein
MLAQRLWISIDEFGYVVLWYADSRQGSYFLAHCIVRNRADEGRGGA